MKQYIVIIVLFVCSCDTVTTKPIVPLPGKNNPIEKKYVNAKSGLRYRASPKGKVLGAFTDNFELDIVTHTNIVEEIKESDTIIKGEWVGVQLKNDTVYVFDAFLSSSRKTVALWDRFPLQQTPIVDSTSFDNVRNTRTLNQNEITTLQLKTIYPNLDKEGYSYKYIPNYTLTIRENFKTISVCVYKGAHELETVLINYTLDGALISHKVISYDEIAEGWSRQISTIKNDMITSIHTQYADTPVKDTTLYHINALGDINKVNTTFKNDIRPNTNIVLHKTYTDTIQFLSYNDDYDYPYIEGQKNNKNVSLIYDWEVDHNTYNFKKNDTIKIIWKMDSIHVAGDGETLMFSETAIGAKKITP